VQGTGFTNNLGTLENNYSGENILVNSSSTTYGNMTINVNVKNNYSTNADASVVFRYKDVNNFYMVMPYSNTLRIYEKLNGTYNVRAQAIIDTIKTGTWYSLRIEVKAGQISAYWNNNLVVTWTDTSPWTSGKVGFRKGNGQGVNWDNFYLWSDGNGCVLSYNDSYPFGLTMPNRSLSYSPVDGRYKFTGKELDAAETGLLFPTTKSR